METEQRTVTHIQRVGKSSDRFAVVMDDGREIRVRGEVIVRLGISAGRKLGEAELRQLREEAELAEAKEAGFRLLAARARTVADLRRRLESRKFSAHAIDETIRMLEQLGLLDDEAYAKQFVHDCLTMRPMGARRITLELCRRGVDEELVRDVVDSLVDQATEKRVALGVARQRLERLKKLDEDAARRKVRAFLARRGFDEDVIDDVLDTACGLPGGA